MKVESEKARGVASPAISAGRVYVKFFTLIFLGVSLLTVLLHFILFQVKHPSEIGVVTTDIVVLGIITTMLLETHHLSRIWRYPFVWINVGILLFFVGSLLEFLGEFFIEPSFIRYSVENGSKMFSFGILAWGFFQWGKEKVEAKKEVEKMRNIDGLTGLPNRSNFFRELRRHQKIAQRYKDFFHSFTLT